MKVHLPRLYLVAVCVVLAVAVTVVPVASCPDPIVNVGWNINTPSASGEAPFVVQFTPVVTHANPSIPIMCSWNFGDGTPSQNTNCDPITHTFTTAGSYGITLAATNACNPPQQQVKQVPGYITVTSAAPPHAKCFATTPAADFNGYPREADVPFFVQFTDQSTGGAEQYTWDFGDGQPVSHDSRPSHQYSLAGRYTVTLTVTETCAGHTDTEKKTDYILAKTQVQEGILDLTSIPSGAKVYMDEAYIGTTPFAIYQPSGTHKLRLTLDGYNDNEISDVIITIGKTTTVKVALTKSSSPSSTTGSLQITSIPDGAAVYIDGGSQGTTPTTINGLTAGSHTMKLTKSGYTDYQQPALTITAGKTLSLNVNLVAGTGSTSPTQTPTPYQTGTTGSLSIISSPSGASVNLDGLDKGTTPVTLDQVKAGSHTLTLTKSGYQDSVKTVTVTGGSTTQVTITLTSQDPNPSPSGLSTLTVRSTPSGANVYVDGEKMGTTPVQIQNVKAGTHKLLLTLQGYSDISQTADITSGSDKEVSVDFGKKAPGFGVPVSLAALALVSLVLLGRRKER